MGSESEKSQFSVLGLSHKFFKAFEKVGGTPGEANTIAEDPDLMFGLLAVLRGNAKVEYVKIDCDVTPFNPRGKCEIRPEDQIASRVCGQVESDPAKIALIVPYLVHNIKISGYDLKKALEGKPVLSANVLDYLLGHPVLIPESWKGKYICFWGTIYCGPPITLYPSEKQDTLFVRYLYWDSDRWDVEHLPLCEDELNDKYQAAVYKF